MKKRLILSIISDGPTCSLLGHRIDLPINTTVVLLKNHPKEFVSRLQLRSGREPPEV